MYYSMCIVIIYNYKIIHFFKEGFFKALIGWVVTRTGNINRELARARVRTAYLFLVIGGILWKLKGQKVTTTLN